MKTETTDYIANAEWITEFLQMQVTVQKICTEGNKTKLPEDWNYTGMTDLILREGKPYVWEPLPEDVERGILKECYRNVFLLCEGRPDLIYVEGYAMGVIPMMHAWAVTKSGIVVDPTWEEGTAYFGIPLKREYVVRSAIEREYYGVIDNWMATWPILQDDPTEWKYDPSKI